jgi:hypothetical protein
VTSIEVAHALVVLNVPPKLEDAIVDWLLSRDDGAGFTSFPVAGHSTNHDHMSAAEQVSGSQRRQQFQIQLPANAVDRLVRELRAQFGAAGVHYWVIPVIEGGSVGSAG